MWSLQVVEYVVIIRAGYLHFFTYWMCGRYTLPLYLAGYVGIIHGGCMEVMRNGYCERFAWLDMLMLYVARYLNVTSCRICGRHTCLDMWKL